MAKPAEPANTSGRTKAYVDKTGRNFANGRLIKAKQDAVKATDPPTKSEQARRREYEQGLLNYGHAMTAKLQREAKITDERSPTHRIFQGPPKKWADKVSPKSGRPRPLRRGGGSPQREDF